MEQAMHLLRTIRLTYNATSHLGKQRLYSNSKTPLLYMLDSPWIFHSALVEWLDIIDSSRFFRGFLQENLVLLFVVILIWLVALPSLLSRTTFCRQWLLAVWRYATAPGDSSPVPFVLLLVSSLVLHDSSARLYFKDDRYMIAASQGFVGMCVAFAGVSHPQFKIIRVRTSLSCLEAFAGGLFVAISVRFSSELEMLTETLSDVEFTWITRSTVAVLGIGVIIFLHGFGRLIGVPFLTYFAQGVGILLEAAVKFMFWTLRRISKYAWSALWVSIRVCWIVFENVTHTSCEVLSTLTAFLQTVFLRIWTKIVTCVVIVADIVTRFVLGVCNIVRQLAAFVWRAIETLHMYLIRPIACWAYVEVIVPVATLCYKFGKCLVSASQSMMSFSMRQWSIINEFLGRAGRVARELWLSCFDWLRGVMKYVYAQFCRLLRELGVQLRMVACVATRAFMKLYRCFLSLWWKMMVWLKPKIFRLSRFLHSSIRQISEACVVVLSRLVRQIRAILTRCQDAITFVALRLWMVLCMVFNKLVNATATIGNLVCRVFLWAHDRVIRSVLHFLAIALNMVLNLLVRASARVVKGIHRVWINMMQGLMQVAAKICLVSIRAGQVTYDIALNIVCFCSDLIVILLQQLWIMGTISMRFFSPLGCFTSATLFGYHLVRRLVYDDSMPIIAVFSYAFAAFGALSVGMLLLGRTLRRHLNRYSYVVALGVRIEALGAWLFLNLDLWILRKMWEWIRSFLSHTSHSVLQAVRHLAGALKWGATQVESFLDLLVRAAWESVSTTWKCVIYPVIECVCSFTWSGILIVWRNPFLCLASSTGAVVYAYFVHIGALQPPDCLKFAVVFDMCKQSLTAFLSKTFSSLVWLSGSAWYGVASIAEKCFSKGFNIVGPWLVGAKDDSLRLVSTLSNRPLELFADSSFSFVHAIITFAFSRLAVAEARNFTTAREVVELATRRARNSQRMLFVPILLSSILYGLPSHMALLFVKTVSVPLGIAYVAISLAVVYGDIRAWQNTSSALLLEQRQREPRDDRPGVNLHAPIVYAEDNDDCTICLERLYPEKATPPKSCHVYFQLENGPRERSGLALPFELSIKSLAQCGPYERNDISSIEPTFVGQWIVNASVDSLYEVRVLDRSSNDILGTSLLTIQMSQKDSGVCSCASADIVLPLDSESQVYRFGESGRLRLRALSVEKWKTLEDWQDIRKAYFPEGLFSDTEVELKFDDAWWEYAALSQNKGIYDEIHLWNLKDVVFLGASRPQLLASEFELMNEQVYTSVDEAVVALNTLDGHVACPEGICYMFSKRHDQYVLLLRFDKKDSIYRHANSELMSLFRTWSYIERVMFEPGEIGLFAEHGKVLSVDRGGQAEKLGVQVGWKLIAIRHQLCTSFADSCVANARNSNASYEATFVRVFRDVDINVIRVHGLVPPRSYQGWFKSKQTRPYVTFSCDGRLARTRCEAPGSPYDEKLLARVAVDGSALVDIKLLDEGENNNDVLLGEAQIQQDDLLAYGEKTVALFRNGRAVGNLALCLGSRPCHGIAKAQKDDKTIVEFHGPIRTRHRGDVAEVHESSQAGNREAKLLKLDAQLLPVLGEEKTHTLRCGHVFHQRCIDSWMRSQNHPVCPVCREAVSGTAVTAMMQRLF